MSRREILPVTSLPFDLLQILPLLDGWTYDVETWRWDELPNPITRGECREIVQVDAGREKWKYLLGIYVAVDSRFLTVMGTQRVGQTWRRLFAAFPLFLYEFGAVRWAPFEVYLTAYDTVNNFYAMCFVPARLLPMNRPVTVVACLGYPTAQMRALPKVPSIMSRTWIDVTDREAHINFLGVAFLEVYDRELFLKSLREAILLVSGIEEKKF